MALKPEDEAEIRVMTRNMFAAGGLANVLASVQAMGETINVILETTHEILTEEYRRKNGDNPR